jgi:uncharacterized membrane protein
VYERTKEHHEVLQLAFQQKNKEMIEIAKLNNNKKIVKVIWSKLNLDVHLYHMTPKLLLALIRREHMIQRNQHRCSREFLP